jgi:hypothetical protein
METSSRSPAARFPIQLVHSADQADVNLKTAGGESCASGNLTALPRFIALDAA